MFRNINSLRTTAPDANRAKSIAVNATKNEEMSAVARLNDEVDQLKRKLAQRADGSMDGEERGMIVTRYESQIHEIELMLRQTWEDKARMSEVHDKAREVRFPIREEFQLHVDGAGGDVGNLCFVACLN